MIQLKVTPRHPAAENDDLGRTVVGYATGDSPETIYEYTRGVWDIRPERAIKEGLAVVACQGQMVGAFTIEDAVRIRDRKTVLTGKPLSPGDKFYDDIMAMDVSKVRAVVHYR